MDLPLKESFSEEVDHLREQIPLLERIVTSPMTRCAQLAEVLAEERGLTISVDARLREMDFGRWEGVPWSQILRSELDEWASDFMHARPHGGESVFQVKTRVAAALNQYIALTGNTLLVTHAGVIKVAFAGGDSASDYSTRVPFGGVRIYGEL